MIDYSWAFAEFSRLLNITSAAAVERTKALLQQTHLFALVSDLTPSFHFLVGSFEAFASTLSHQVPILLEKNVSCNEENRRFPLWILVVPSPPLGQAISTSSDGFSPLLCFADELWEESWGPNISPCQILPGWAPSVYKRRKINIKHLKSRTWNSQFHLNTKLQRVSFPSKMGQRRDEPEIWSSILLVY